MAARLNRPAALLALYAVALAAIGFIHHPGVLAALLHLAAWRWAPPARPAWP